jgi:transposase
MAVYAGIDWGGTAHAVCVIDDSAAPLAQFEIKHQAAGLAELVVRLRKFVHTPTELRVAIERPSGLLVDSLLDAGFALVPIHPNVVKASRPRYRAAPGKCDRSDAYLLADLLRTDGHRFRVLAPECDAIRALRALVRTRDALVGQRVALANQLRSLLESFWPGAAAIFAEVDSPIALAFLERYPTSHSAARLGEKRLRSFLATHAYCGRRHPTVLLERLRNAAHVPLGEHEAQAKGELVKALVRILTPLVAQLATLSARIEHDVAALRDGQLVMSFPRSGRINAAQLLCELGSVRERFATEAQLAAEAGVCPVTYQSGKSRGVAFRWACNHRLRAALTTWAANSRSACPWAADIYQRARRRGAQHPHAVRILARAWVRVLWRCWIDQRPYDPAKHHAAAPLLATA